MHNWQILAEILLLLSVALLFGTIAERFRQSAIIGFLLAGAVVGPHGLGWVRAGDHLELIAELGVALLLFTIGLEFSFQRLRRLGTAALMGGVLQVVVTLFVVFLAAKLLGMSARTGFALGAMFALSSTATVLRLLTDEAALERPYGRLTLAILLVQDIAVFPLALLVSAMSRGGTAAQVAWELLQAAGAAALMIAAFLFLFNKIVPRLLNIREWSRNREFPILLAVIMALGSAAVAHAAGISPAIGAFLAGVLLGESVFAAQIRADVASVKAVLVTFFFASVGLLFEGEWAFENWAVVVGVAACLILCKALLVWGILRALKVHHENALASGICLAQVGEFAFVLSGIAGGTLFDEDLGRLVVSVTMITLFVAPFIVDRAPQLAAAGIALVLSRRTRAEKSATGSGPAGTAGKGVSPSLVVIGFGPAAQKLLDSLPVAPAPRITVIDLNPRAQEIATRYGAHLHIGHAGHREVLEEAGVGSARAIIITIPDPSEAVSIIHLCRHINPGIYIVARARYHMYRPDLEAAGADAVVDEEQKVGEGLASSLQALLGLKGTSLEPPDRTGM